MRRVGQKNETQTDLFAIIVVDFWQQTLSRRADSEDQEDDDGKAQDAQELLNEIEQSKNQETGKIEDSHVIKFFRDKLHSKPCQNQGFILDGFPKTIEHANDLFASKCMNEYIVNKCILLVMMFVLITFLVMKIISYIKLLFLLGCRRNCDIFVSSYTCCRTWLVH